MHQKTSNFLRYIHNFRGIAILLIVLGHVTTLIHLDNSQEIDALIHVVVTNGSVYFIFIAGFLFQLLSKKYEYRNYLEKKLNNVILPYLLISIPAVSLCLIKNEPFYGSMGLATEFANWTLFKKIGFLYLTGGHFFHFWFIPMITIFYLVAPAFIWIDRHPKFYTILLLLLLVSIIVPRAEDDNLILQNFIHFSSVYVLGMFCCHYREAVLSLMEKYWRLWLIAAIALLILETVLEVTSSPLVTVIYINTISKSILSVLLLYLLWRFDSTFSSNFHKKVGKLAELSFGIYFLHGYTIYIYAWIGKNMKITLLIDMGYGSLILSLFLILTLTIMSLLTIQRLLGKKSRYFIGC